MIVQVRVDFRKTDCWWLTFRLPEQQLSSEWRVIIRWWYFCPLGLVWIGQFCRNEIELPSPRRSRQTNNWYPWVQTIYHLPSTKKRISYKLNLDLCFLSTWKSISICRLCDTFFFFWQLLDENTQLIQVRNLGAIECQSVPSSFCKLFHLNLKTSIIMRENLLL